MKDSRENKDYSCNFNKVGFDYKDNSDDSLDKDNVSSSRIDLPISYVAVKNVNNEAVYDFYSHGGKIVGSSLIRLKNNCYPFVMEFNFFMKDNTLFYVIEQGIKKLFACEEAVPLNQELVAFKNFGSPYWGIANNKGEIILPNIRYGRIFGMTSNGNILCLLSFVKAGVINLKSMKVLHEFSCKDSAISVSMNPQTSNICIGTDLIFTGKGKTFVKGVTQIVSETIFMGWKGKVFCGEDTVQLSKKTRHLNHNDVFLWSSDDTKSYNLISKTLMNFIPVDSMNNRFMVRYPDNLFGLYDSTESKELVKKAKKMFLIGKGDFAIYQTNDDKIFLYNILKNKKIRLDAEYELIFSSIVKGRLWLVNKFEDKFCCFVFDLEGNEIIGDRWCQYGFFSPMDDVSFVYIKDECCMLVNYETRKETLLCDFHGENKLSSKNYMIIPKMESFLIVSDDESWLLMSTSGKLLQNFVSSNIILNYKDEMEKFINTDIIIVKERKESGNGIDLVGAFNSSGQMVIPCQYNHIECW